MVRSTPIQGGDHLCSIPLAIGLFLSVSALVALCAKHATRRHSTKYAVQSQAEPTKYAVQSQTEPRSPLRSPREIFSSIQWKKSSEKSGSEVDKGYGEGGLWQKSIMMGEKCQPPEFSGVIYYDPLGNQISELPPKSPRPPSPLRNYSFPVASI